MTTLNSNDSNPSTSNPNPEALDAESLASATEADAVFQRRRAELAAVPDADLLPINVGPFHSFVVIHGAWRDSAVVREQLASLPGFNLELASSARDYALCYRHTSTESATAGKLTPAAQKLLEEATALRDRFAKAIEVLVSEGVIDASRVARPKVIIGYRGVAEDLERLSTVLRSAWFTVDGRTTLTTADVVRGKRLAEELIIAISENEQVTPPVSEAAALQQRAFTLMVRAYEELRRGVMYLRFYQRDADRITPSLYGGRRVSSKSQKAEGTEDEGAGLAESGSVIPPRDERDEPAAPAASPAPGPALGGLPVGEPFVAA